MEFPMEKYRYPLSLKQKETFAVVTAVLPWIL